eukprot:jgi/Ulvmu1/4992/UM021_0009.1
MCAGKASATYCIQLDIRPCPHVLTGLPTFVEVCGTGTKVSQAVNKHGLFGVVYSPVRGSGIDLRTYHQCLTGSSLSLSFADKAASERHPDVQMVHQQMEQCVLGAGALEAWHACDGHLVNKTATMSKTRNRAMKTNHSHYALFPLTML